MSRSAGRRSRPPTSPRRSRRRAQRACLLVLGRDTASDVTRRLVAHAPCPVAVTPLSVPLAAREGLERIGVAYDGSPGADTALTAGARLAAATGARLVVLAAGRSAEDAELTLELCPGLSGAAGTRVLIGDPAVELERASGELDLLVCGSRGRSRAVAAILGSVSVHLVGHARCPLVVLPATARPGAVEPLGLSSAGVTE